MVDFDASTDPLDRWGPSRCDPGDLYRSNTTITIGAGNNSSLLDAQLNESDWLNRVDTCWIDLSCSRFTWQQPSDDELYTPDDIGDSLGLLAIFAFITIGMALFGWMAVEMMYFHGQTINANPQSSITIESRQAAPSASDLRVKRATAPPARRRGRALE